LLQLFQNLNFYQPAKAVLLLFMGFPKGVKNVSPHAREAAASSSSCNISLDFSFF
jgi:hypothetical protein